MGARGGGAEWFAADPPPYINSIAAAVQMPAATRKKNATLVGGASPRPARRQSTSHRGRTPRPQDGGKAFAEATRSPASGARGLADDRRRRVVAQNDPGALARAFRSLRSRPHPIKSLALDGECCGRNVRLPPCMMTSLVLCAPIGQDANASVSANWVSLFAGRARIPLTRSHGDEWPPRSESSAWTATRRHVPRDSRAGRQSSVVAEGTTLESIRIRLGQTAPALSPGKMRPFSQTDGIPGQQRLGSRYAGSNNRRRPPLLAVNLLPDIQNHDHRLCGRH
ncbi:hypothetical protein HPB50_023337 [Hyalomma asiaticum]|uniref:Uncharacterized protein n=1 Tax=Hyalomma asiaticum TaxID=266040 RepID=A0ACB7TMJ7_HYAAI|nr:hypothetical protein HPB50_023337 [Hyalomma asiaticum]